jgi:divalent metal cation (Fe/Co/Zn/Cd) transporter
MNIVSILFFLAAALLGITLLFYLFKNKNTPKAFVLSHGFLATLGLLALVVYAIQQDLSLLSVALVFLLAAMGGIYLSIRDLLGLSVPKWLAIGHGIIALVGVVLFFVYQ